MDYTSLINAAKKARENSYSPYSGFKVGAALLTKNGSIYSGCNIENAAYGDTVCAERIAFFKAISEGEMDFEAIAIVGGVDNIDEICTPCGTCRQVMSEFCSLDFKIVLGSPDKYKIYTLSEMLPHSFSKSSMR